MQPDPLLERFFGAGINSANRLQIMLQELEHHPRSTFWSSFQAVWPTCDDTWFTMDLALEALRWNGPAVDFLSGADREFYVSLPDMIEVYRGCRLSRLRGLSWTTDRTVAASFALGHRGIPVPDAVIASTRIPNWAVLTVSTERGESELLIDPDLLPDDLALATL